MASTVVGGVLTSHQLLGECIMVVTVDFHHTKVSVRLQLGSGELRIRVDGSGLEGSVFMFSMYSSLQEAKNRAHAIVMIVMYLDCLMIYLFRISHLH